LGSVADKSGELKNLGDYVYKVDINSVDLCWEYCGTGGHELRTLYMALKLQLNGWRESDYFFMTT
jgi:hypothetical protein